MQIAVLKGSSNKHGSSNLLASYFIKGAKEAGHQIIEIDAGHAKIHPCNGCIRCGYEGPCIQKDAMDDIKKQILSSDMLLFVTPLYYFGMSAQLKTLVDRFCSFNSSIARKHLKSALICAAWNDDSWTFNALKEHYQTLVHYLNFHDQGMILGGGCGTVLMTERSSHLDEAYRLGLKLKDD